MSTTAGAPAAAAPEPQVPQAEAEAARDPQVAQAEAAAARDPQVAQADAAAAPEPQVPQASAAAAGEAQGAQIEAAATAATTPEALPATSSKHLAVLTLAHAITHMRGAILPLIYPMVMSSMGFGYVSLGAMLSITRIVGGSMQGIWGWVSRYVPAKWLIFGEQLGMGAGIWLTAGSANLGELTGAVTFGQVASSPHHPLASSMLSRWYGKRRGTALSVHFAGANVATLLSPLIFTFLLARWGWRPSLLVFTIPCVLGALAVALSLPNEGRQAVGRRAGGRGREGDGAAARGDGFFAPLRDPLVRRLIITASVTAGGKGLGVVLTFIPLLLIRDMHLATVTAGLIFTAFAATSVVGPTVVGRLSDRYPRPRFLSALLLCCAVLAVVLAGYSRLGLFGLVPVLLVFGGILYACSPIEQAIMGDITAESLSGQAYSLFYGLTFPISALWPVILAALVARWGFSALFLTIAATYVAGFLIYGTMDWTPKARRPAEAKG